MYEYCGRFEAKVKRTISKYKLCTKKEKILVALSGGKDSTSVLYLLKKFGYNVEGLMINLRIGEWSDLNLKNVEKFCAGLGVKLNIVDIKDDFGSSICYIRHGIQARTKLNNCTICGVIKRWILNKYSRELGADKLATGHNLDDEAETILMNYFKGKPELSFRLGPITGIVRDKKFVRRIKPLYFCTNSEIRKYSEKMKFPVVYKPCPCSVGVFRRDVREMISELSKNASKSKDLRHHKNQRFLGNPNLKKNVVNGFLRLLPKFRKTHKPEKIKYCKICEEPSMGEICKRCELMGILRKNN